MTTCATCPNEATHAHSILFEGEDGETVVKFLALCARHTGQFGARVTLGYVPAAVVRTLIHREV